MSKKAKRKNKNKKLTLLQRRFAELYDGNGTETCKQAGYKGTDNSLAQQAIDNLRIPKIVEIIQKREEKALEHLLAHKRWRQRFWAKLMHDEKLKIPDRLRSSELLGKSCGDFIDVNVNDDRKLEDILSEANKPK